MGKLRIEPKIKPLLSEQEYDFYKDVLAKAHRAAPEHNLYWDLESGEKIRDVRKAFQYVAEKEGISLKVRGQRGSDSLKLSFVEWWPNGDADDDGDVDVNDFASLPQCLNGPDNGYGPDCQVFDFNLDNDIDGLESIKVCLVG